MTQYLVNNLSALELTSSESIVRGQVTLLVLISYIQVLMLYIEFLLISFLKENTSMTIEGVEPTLYSWL